MAMLGWALNLDFAAGGGVSIPATLEDLTTLWCHDYQPALHAAAAARSDDSGQIMINLAANVIGYDSENDINTALAKYIEVTY